MLRSSSSRSAYSKLLELDFTFVERSWHRKLGMSIQKSWGETFSSFCDQNDVYDDGKARKSKLQQTWSILL
jgi:hypothetical protein